MRYLVVRRNATTPKSSLFFVPSSSGNYDHGILTNLPAGFGVGEFTLDIWFRADNSFPVGDTTVAGAAKRQNWSNSDPTPYASEGWPWWYGNFLLDGHNNNNSANGTFDLQIYGGGRLRWLFGDGAAAAARLGDLHCIQPSPTTSMASVLDGNWHKGSCVRRWDGGTGAILELWFDGTLIATETTTARTNMVSSFWSTWPGFPAGQQGFFFGAEKIAATGGAEWEDFKGHIDELAFWSIARSSAALANWQQPTIGNEPGLIDIYRFNDGAGSIVAAEKGSASIALFNMDPTAWRNIGAPV